MSFPVETGAVRAVVATKDGPRATVGRIVGYPASSGGEPSIAELMLDDGRTTTADVCNVTPLDAAARSLLKGRPRTRA